MDEIRYQSINDEQAADMSDMITYRPLTQQKRLDFSILLTEANKVDDLRVLRCSWLCLRGVLLLLLRL